MKPKFADIRNRLQFVRFRPDQDLDLEPFPDFLIVGPQRTGTTWLRKNLIAHPQVFMPVRKELYYFNNIRTDEYHPKHLPAVRPDLEWYLEFFRPGAVFLTLREIECRVRWGERYEIAVRGEGTATYSAGLHPEVIREITILNPDVKILTMVRNPIDRAWSHAKKDLARERRRPAEQVPDDEWIEFVEAAYQIECGHFSRQWQRWTSVVPERNYFVGKFDDIVSDPVGLLVRAFAFLGIRADAKYVGARARKTINPTESAPIPRRVREVLDRIYRDEIALLRDRSVIA